MLQSTFLLQQNFCIFLMHFLRLLSDIRTIFVYTAIQKQVLVIAERYDFDLIILKCGLTGFSFKHDFIMPSLEVLTLEILVGLR